MNNALLTRLRDAWGALAPGERRLALAGAVLLAVLVLYLALWLPIKQDLARLRAGVPEQQAQLARMRSQAAMIQPLRGRTGAAPAPGMLLPAVEQSATARGVKGFLTRMEADGANAVQIQAEAAPFNSLIAWLAELQENQALVVDNATLDAHSGPGLVHGRIRLRLESP
jgi:general secretion pathway protein M